MQGYRFTSLHPALALLTFLSHFHSIRKTIYYKSLSSLISAENTHLDDLYTRYRQRLRKSLFISGLSISLVACAVSMIVVLASDQVSGLTNIFPENFPNVIVLSTILHAQNVLHLVMLVIAAIVCGSILTALQFPAVLSSPFAALAFAISTTATLAFLSVIVGGTLAPLPLFAVILVRSFG